MYKLLIIPLLLISTNTWGCSFMPTKMAFKTSSIEKIEPIVPTFELNHRVRGEDDGNHGSCSDAGVISLKIKEISSIEQVYIFEIIEGTFEDTLFDTEPVIINDLIEDKSTYSFIWFDGSYEEQEAINIKVKIIAVSRSGHQSDPQFIEIKHPGIKKPWWKLW
jgi:hypothetical protein